MFSCPLLVNAGIAKTSLLLPKHWRWLEHHDGEEKHLKEELHRKLAEKKKNHRKERGELQKAALSNLGQGQTGTLPEVAQMIIGSNSS